MYLSHLLLSNLRRTTRWRIPGNLYTGKMRLWPKAKPWEMKYYFEDVMREQSNIKLLQTPFLSKVCYIKLFKPFSSFFNC